MSKTKKDKNTSYYFYSIVIEPTKNDSWIDSRATQHVCKSMGSFVTMKEVNRERIDYKWPNTLW